MLSQGLWLPYWWTFVLSVLVALCWDGSTCELAGFCTLAKELPTPSALSIMLCELPGAMNAILLTCHLRLLHMFVPSLYCLTGYHLQHMLLASVAASVLNVVGPH